MRARIELADDEGLHAAPAHRCSWRVRTSSRRDVRSPGEEARAPRRPPARADRSRPRPQDVADGRRVDDPDRPAVLAGERRPVRVEAPAHAQVGERQQRRERVAMERGHGADLDEVRRRAPVSPAWRRVTAQAACEWWRCAGWAIRRPYCSAGVQERVEEPARQRDVVVEHEQPVEAPEVAARQQRVEVLELAAVAAARVTASSMSWRERRSSVTAAVSSETTSRRSTASTSTRARVARARRAAQAPRPARGREPRVGERVAPARDQRASALDVAAARPTGSPRPAARAAAACAAPPRSAPERVPAS